MKINFKFATIHFYRFILLEIECRKKQVQCEKNECFCHSSINMGARDKITDAGTNFNICIISWFLCGNDNYKKTSLPSILLGKKGSQLEDLLYILFFTNRQ